MLKIIEIAKAYGTSQVLDGVSLMCREGEAVCIAGANATGKTTLLTITAGLMQPDSGSISCDGGLGCVPQETALLTELTVRENLALWYAAHNRPKRELFATASVESALGLDAYAKRRVTKLSGGIKKRTAIACALVGNPAYLLMDEPFTALDLQSRADIISLLCTLKAQGKGLLFTSHDPSAIAAVADRVVLLKNGTLAQEAALAGEDSARTVQVIEMLSRA